VRAFEELDGVAIAKHDDGLLVGPASTDVRAAALRLGRDRDDLDVDDSSSIAWRTWILWALLATRNVNRLPAIRP
jgi:hypothetical protein